jgi:hypothetical protein
VAMSLLVEVAFPEPGGDSDSGEEEGEWLVAEVLSWLHGTSAHGAVVPLPIRVTPNFEGNAVERTVV